MPPVTTVNSRTVCRTRRRDALSDALKLLRTDWTRDHLMGTAPETDAAILSSPLQQLHSLAFESSCRFDPLDPSKVGFNAAMNIESVVIPAFSKDGLNAGYLVEDSYGLFPESVILCHTGAMSFRFLAREDNGTFVGVLRLPDKDILLHFKLTNRSGSFTCFGFHANSLDYIVANEIDDVDVMEKMLHSAVTTTSTYKCPICSADTHCPCACKPHFHRSKTPLDLRAFTLNMIQTQLGQCAGTGLYEEFANGGSNEIIPLGSQRKSFRVAKQGSMKKLINWAIADVLRTTPISIQRVIASPLESHGDLPSLSPLPASQSSVLVDAFTGPPLLLDNVPEPAKSSEISPESVYFDDPHTFPDIIVPPALPMKKKQRTTYNTPSTPVNDPFWPLDFSLSPVGSSDDCSGLCVAPNTAEQHVLPMPAAIPPVVLPGPAIPQMTRITPKPAPMIKIAPAPARNTTSGIGTPIAPLGKVGVPLAPGVTHFSEEMMQKTAEELRAYKAYQRKIRNRESAARSNLARKQRRQELARLKAQSASS